MFDRVFASAEWSWQSYATRTLQGTSGRQRTSAVYLGGGYAQPLSGSTAIVLEVAYDVTGNAKVVYGTGWALRAGVTTGF